MLGGHQAHAPELRAVGRLPSQWGWQRDDDGINPTLYSSPVLHAPGQRGRCVVPLLLLPWASSGGELLLTRRFFNHRPFDAYVANKRWDGASSPPRGACDDDDGDWDGEGGAMDRDVVVTCEAYWSAGRTSWIHPHAIDDVRRGGGGGGWGCWPDRGGRSSYR